MAPANPLRGPSSDSAYIASLLDQIPGPVLAVGHSYGRAVITNAATNANNVVGLVYVAAFAPDEGERLGDVASTSKDSILSTASVPLQYPTGEGSETAVEFVVDPEKFQDVFAADLPAEETAVMAATQRPVAELSFSEPNGVPAWKTLPAWAVVATSDKAALYRLREGATETPELRAEARGSGAEAAIEHAAAGAAAWEWASNDGGGEPDVVLGCAGDIPTLETVAAAHWLRENAPELRVRVVNVVDLMTLFPQEFHPHGMDETRFVELFTADKPVVFAFHGYQRAIHEIVHGHVDVDRFHVRGFSEQGTTTTPFDMVVLNGMSRYHLAAEALRRVGEASGSRLEDRASTLISECEAAITRATAYSREHFEDPPEISNWTWTP